MTGIKICGLSDEAGVEAAGAGGADFAGFVFYPPSPRCVSPERAAVLAEKLPPNTKSVALLVDPDDTVLDYVLNRFTPDYIQLHGDETPKQILDIKKKFSPKIIKAIRIGSKRDLLKSMAYDGIADILMFDAKIEGSALPGGMGQAFDWSILEGHKPETPWMLAGGLTAENVKEALSRLHPDVVDVSSGVESAPGQKDPAKIADFIRAVKNHDHSKQP
ncbi:MAG: phosphoribosylanthranilate isomerase [Alphaproteobacteria bacterium]